MKQKGFTPIILIFILGVVALGGFFGMRYVQKLQSPGFELTPEVAQKQREKAQTTSKDEFEMEDNQIGTYEECRGYDTSINVEHDGYRIEKGNIISRKQSNEWQVIAEALSFKSAGPDEVCLFHNFVVSPDKSKLAITLDNGASSYSLFLFDNNNINYIGLTLETAFWSPDSKFIAFTSKPADIGPSDLYVYSVDKKKLTELIEPEKSCVMSYYKIRWTEDSNAVNVNYDCYTTATYGEVVEKGETQIRFK